LLAIAVNNRSRNSIDSCHTINVWTHSPYHGGEQFLLVLSEITDLCQNLHVSTYSFTHALANAANGLRNITYNAFVSDIGAREIHLHHLCAGGDSQLSSLGKIVMIIIFAKTILNAALNPKYQ
jgi:hypothetical protein